MGGQRGGCFCEELLTPHSCHPPEAAPVSLSPASAFSYFSIFFFLLLARFLVLISACLSPLLTCSTFLPLCPFSPLPFPIPSPLLPPHFFHSPLGSCTRISDGNGQDRGLEGNQSQGRPPCPCTPLPALLLHVATSVISFTGLTAPLREGEGAQPRLPGTCPPDLRHHPQGTTWRQPWLGPREFAHREGQGSERVGPGIQEKTEKGDLVEGRLRRKLGALALRNDTTALVSPVLGCHDGKQRLLLGKREPLKHNCPHPLQ